MYNRVGHARAALMGLLFAMVGFTYAVASSRSLETTAGAESRAGVGTETLRFLNNVVSGDRDLGDVTLGSFITRYVRAAGGAGALTYTSTTSPTLKSVLGSTSTLELLANGILGGAGTQGGGSISGLAASVFPLRFKVDVADQRGSTPQTARDTFRLSLENSTSFKFAIDDLGDAVQFISVVDVVSTVNGNGTVTVSASNVKLNGTAVTGGLEALGLSLASDGTISGQPLQVGTVTFDATAKDAKGNSALSRDKASTGQKITLNIISNSLIQTNVVCTSLKLKVANPKGTAKSGNRDSLRYSGLINLGQRKVSDLNGDALRLVVGGYTSPNTTDTPATLQSGKTAKAPKGVKAAKFKGSVSQKGQVKISITSEDMSRVSKFTGSSTNLAVGLMVGDAVASAQILTLSSKSGNNGVSAGYKFGSSNTPAGTFLITRVKGKDDSKSTAEDDAWQAQFVATPQTGAKFAGADSAVVSIGLGFSDTIKVKEKNGKVSQDEKRDNKSAKVTQIKMDESRGKGSVKTGPLPSTGTTGTNIREAAKASSSSFPLNVALFKGTAPLYTGENSGAIESNGKNSWQTPRK